MSSSTLSSAPPSSDPEATQLSSRHNMSPKNDGSAPPNNRKRTSSPEERSSLLDVSTPSTSKRRPKVWNPAYVQTGIPRKGDTLAPRTIQRHEAANVIDANGEPLDPQCIRCQKAHLPRMCFRWNSALSPSLKCSDCFRLGQPCSRDAALESPFEASGTPDCNSDTPVSPSADPRSESRSRKYIWRHATADRIEKNGTRLEEPCARCSKGRVPRVCIRWDHPQTPSGKCGACVRSGRGCSRMLGREMKEGAKIANGDRHSEGENTEKEDISQDAVPNADRTTTARMMKAKRMADLNNAVQVLQTRIRSLEAEKEEDNGKRLAFETVASESIRDLMIENEEARRRLEELERIVQRGT